MSYAQLYYLMENLDLIVRYRKKAEKAAADQARAEAKVRSRA